MNTETTKVWKPEGELTIYTANDCRKALIQFTGARMDFEIDLSAVTEVDTAGLQLLMAAKVVCMASGISMWMTNHSQPCLDVLDLCNLNSFFGDPVVISH
jgi:anti-sigma B factor antagonist